MSAPLQWPWRSGVFLVNATDDERDQEVRKSSGLLAVAVPRSVGDRRSPILVTAEDETASKLADEILLRLAGSVTTAASEPEPPAAAVEWDVPTMEQVRADRPSARQRDGDVCQHCKAKVRCDVRSGLWAGRFLLRNDVLVVACAARCGQGIPAGCAYACSTQGASARVTSPDVRFASLSDGLTGIDRIYDRHQLLQRRGVLRRRRASQPRGRRRPTPSL